MDLEAYDVINTFAIFTSDHYVDFTAIPPAKKIVHVILQNKKMIKLKINIFCKLYGFVLIESDDSIGYMHFTRQSNEIITREIYNERMIEAKNELYVFFDNLKTDFKSYESVQRLIEFLKIYDKSLLFVNIFEALRKEYPQCESLTDKQIIEDFMWSTPECAVEIAKIQKQIDAMCETGMRDVRMVFDPIFEDFEYEKRKVTIEQLKHATDYIVYIQPRNDINLPKQCLDELRNIRTLCITHDSYMGHINNSWLKPYTPMYVSKTTMRERNVTLLKMMPTLKTIVFCGWCKPTQLFIEDVIKDKNLVVYGRQTFYHGTTLKGCDKLVKYAYRR